MGGPEMGNYDQHEQNNELTCIAADGKCDFQNKTDEVEAKQEQQEAGLRVLDNRGLVLPDSTEIASSQELGDMCKQFDLGVFINGENQCKASSSTGVVTLDGYGADGKNVGKLLDGADLSIFKWGGVDLPDINRSDFFKTENKSSGRSIEESVANFLKQRNGKE